MKIRSSLRVWRILLVLAVLLAGFAGLQQSAQPVSAQATPPRTVFVHLFEWKWVDIAQECENYLGPKGFAAVQVSPPNEHAKVSNNPWWERYQPVSYQLQSRSGTRQEFINMVQRCKAVGVDVYVDAVINHMTGVGSGTSIAGTSYTSYAYPNLYGYQDFHHCNRNGNDDISNYQDRWEVQNCELVNLADLNTGSDYVRGKLAAYLQDLVNIGVAGFRLDASKHMDTNDIKAILSRVTGNFYVFQEVIDQGGEPIVASEYFQNGDVTEFKYSLSIGSTFYSGQLANLSQFGTAWGFMSSDSAVVFTDNHDNQRGHGGGGHVLTYKDGRLYDLANVFMLAWPYGYPSIMSSYDFTDGNQGPPADSNGNTLRVYNTDGSMNCFGTMWKCEHRWTSIGNMVEFRNVTSEHFAVSNWWTNGNNQIAFSRGDNGFVAINKESSNLTRVFQTGLPAGTYCNVFDGTLNTAGNGCTGTSFTVNADGTANITVASMTAVALHTGKKTSGGGGGFSKVYNQVYFRGTPNSWGTTAMALVGNNTWQTVATFGGASTDRFKFDIYGDWTLNFGDTNNDKIADQSGSDIYVTTSGTYTITFNDSTKAYTVVSSGGGGGGGTVPVSFYVTNATTQMGENIYVVGNIAALGSWNPCSAVKLSPTNYPTWNGTINLPASTAVEYKYIRYSSCSSVTWQSGANKTFTTPASGPVTRNDAW